MSVPLPFSSFFIFSLLHAEDEEFSDIMELVSETENCSAKLARDKNATEEQKKEDRKRRKIGIGETVTVTLNCKNRFTGTEGSNPMESD